MKKIKTAVVITIVEIVVESSEEFTSRREKSTVASAEAVRFTILLPIRIVVISLSYFSSAKLHTRAACFLPSAAMLFNLIRLAQEYAVSVAEKSPEKITSTTTAIVRGTIVSSGEKRCHCRLSDCLL